MFAVIGVAMGHCCRHCQIAVAILVVIIIAINAGSFLAVLLICWVVLFTFLGALPVMAQEETSASGETASEAPSNASRAAWSLRDLTEKGYGATDAALALLASGWDLNAAAALLESHAQTLDLLGLASDKLTQSANPTPPQEAPGAASGALTIAPMCSCGRTCCRSGKGWATHCCSQCTRDTHTDNCEKRERRRRQLPHSDE